MSMRVELDSAKTYGRTHRQTSRTLGHIACRRRKGDGIEPKNRPANSLPRDACASFRQRSDGLISPSNISCAAAESNADVLKALSEGREGFSLANLTVAGWPGPDGSPSPLAASRCAS